ncbi:hypothetical protein [Rhodoplanes sp. Z2-YC6860]|uniref:hypothetical protein n=1 Tax=Rhodoplanes sp. Z2-YC6860 TaxID=674703 RepID=UPI00082D8DFC|nr:hypothetical protein [Rhodoplanes sp. Z2-YC6860]
MRAPFGSIAGRRAAAEHQSSTQSADDLPMKRKDSRILRFAGTRQIDFKRLGDLSGPAAQHNHAVGQESASSMLWVTSRPVGASSIHRFCSNSHSCRGRARHSLSISA